MNKMKKLFLTVILCSCLSLLTACGGKDDVTELAEDYGFSKSEVKEIQEQLNESGDIETAFDDNDNEVADSEEHSFELVEVSDAIKNSHLEDDIVQVGNVVLKNDASLSIQDIISALKGQWKEIRIVDKNRNEVTGNTLMQPGQYTNTLNLETLYVYNEYENELCTLYISNTTGEMINMMDALVVDIRQPMTGMESLNFFYPGNVCAILTASYSQDKKESEAYLARLAEYPNMKYTDWDSWLDSVTNKYVFSGLLNSYADTEYSFTVIQKDFEIMLGDKGIGKAKSFNFYLDTNTGEFDHTLMDFVNNRTDVDYYTSVYTLEYAGSEELKQIETECAEKLKKDYITEDEVTLIGWYLEKERFTNKQVMCVFTTNKGSYVSVMVGLGINHKAQVYPDRIQCDFSVVYESLEELEQAENCSVLLFE